MNEFIARNGLIAQNNSVVSGSLTVTQGITGSLLGSSSYSTTASFAISSSTAVSSSFSSTASFVNPLNQNVTITGSLLMGTGSTLITPSYGLTPNLSIGMNTGSTGAVLDLRNTSGSSPAGSVLGTIQFSSYSTSGNYITSPAGIRVTTSEQATTGTNGGGNIAFWTANIGFGDFQFERMRVNNLGQVLIGLTSSLDTTSKLIVSGSTLVTGLLNVTQGITGSLFGTSSFATQALSASFATTASFAPNYVLNSSTSSMLAPYVLTSQTSSMTVLSSSFAVTASYALNAGGGGGGGTDIGLVQAMTVGLQNIF